MKLQMKKIDAGKMYGAILWLLILVLIGYEVYLIYGLNKDLQVAPAKAPQRVTRFDTQKFDNALQLYNNYTKTQEIVDVPDPFASTVNVTPAP